MLLFCLVFFHLFIDFRGLLSAEGMDQAQVAREIARGNGFVTKLVRPFALYKINNVEGASGEEAALAPFSDSYHAPLHPLLNSILLRVFQSKWEYERDAPVYYLDRVIAVGSALLFLAAAVVSCILITRIFDGKIAVITGVLLMLSELLWNFAQSGLPQMLMLFLFSLGLYFLYRAVECSIVGEPSGSWLAIAGGFFGLLALAHWLTLWIFLGALVFVFLYFRPHGRSALVFAGTVCLVGVLWGLRNWIVSGSPMGIGIYGIYNGLNGGTEGIVMRNFDPVAYPLPADGLPTKLILGSLGQLNDLYPYLGSIVVAPIFFLSLVHPFRRPEIAAFRWAILGMWLAAVAGMTVFGLTKGRLDPNQLHVLFIPMMTAYGLAFLMVLWSRLGLGTAQPAIRNLHIIVVIALSAAPLLLQFPHRAVMGILYKGFPNWPPYVPQAIERLGDWTDEEEVIVSDVPWAVAWYADRVSLWLPSTPGQLELLEDYAAGKGTPIAGIFLTPVTIDGKVATEVMKGEYGPWARLVTRGELFQLGLEAMEDGFSFPFAKAMPSENQSFFYSDRRRWLESNRGDAAAK
jgi:hypothetical protein